MGTIGRDTNLPKVGSGKCLFRANVAGGFVFRCIRKSELHCGESLGRECQKLVYNP